MTVLGGQNLVVQWLRDVDERPHEPGDEPNWK
jgi:hypothetical protein